MVSVIICTYNYGRFIRQAIESVLKQSYPGIECIVIDNGSTDNTAEVVRSFGDSRIRYQQQAHAGVSAARNKGLMISRGEYICFLDADDLIEREKFLRAVALLESDKTTDLVYSDMRYFRDPDITTQYFTYGCRPGDQPWMKYRSGSGKPIVSELLSGNMMVICSPVFRKSLLAECGYFDESLEMNEDWDLWMRMALADKKFVYQDEPETRALVRVHGSSLSRDIFRMQVSGLRVLLKNRDAIRGFQLEDQLNARIQAHRDAILSSLVHGPVQSLKERYDYLVQYNLRDQPFLGPWSFNKFRLSWRLKKIR